MPTEQQKAEAYVRTQIPELTAIAEASELNDQSVAHMVSRFLGWELPEDFRPDAGISFEKFVGTKEYPYTHMPSGTNLFDATQAEAMIRYMFSGLPYPIQLQHWLRVIPRSDYLVDVMGNVWKFEKFDDDNNLVLKDTVMKFDLTTGQPATEADYKAFNLIVGS